MAEPTVKSPKINKLIDSLLGNSRVDSIKSDICAFCKRDANEFRDELSKKEYTISGLCQKCQDEVFGGEEDA